MTLKIKLVLLLIANVFLIFLVTDLVGGRSYWARAAAISLVVVDLVCAYLLYRSLSKKREGRAGTVTSGRQKRLFKALVAFGIVFSVQCCYGLFLMVTEGRESYSITGLVIQLAMALLCFFAASRVRKKQVISLLRCQQAESCMSIMAGRLTGSAGRTLLVNLLKTKERLTLASGQLQKFGNRPLRRALHFEMYVSKFFAFSLPIRCA